MDRGGPLAAHMSYLPIVVLIVINWVNDSSKLTESMVRQALRWLSQPSTSADSLPGRADSALTQRPCTVLVDLLAALMVVHVQSFVELEH